ncbi:hypothetical protein LIER_30407 [Lithospermum erythrorhizon]|uniref:non-specific serine/threonine protein kinase n=1 Tax=Lithospermum erythrorhizon TaxID=34254 RepID=A0AAV3RMK7_LITER
MLISPPLQGTTTNESDPPSFDSSTPAAASSIEDKLSTCSCSENTTTPSPKNTLSHSTTPHAGSNNDPCLNAIREIQSKTTKLDFHDFCFIDRLGSGDIGTVYLVEVKEKIGCLFAAKVMDKEELVSRKKENRANIEREILEMLNHPFLPTLYTTLESPKWACLLTEFCPGGDLHILRQQQPERRFDEPAVRFYASEVVVALEYLHMLGIIYRDLKPENVLVRADGHIMLTDFDLSLKCDNSTSMAHLVYDLSSLDKNQAEEDHNSIKTPHVSKSSCILPSCITPSISCFHPFRRRPRRRPTPHRGPIEMVAEPVDARSMSFVGTYEYLAPEIASGEGHGSAVDWWTVGIFIFELFYGVTPFRGLDNEHTMANIMARALEFPKEPPNISNAAKDLISMLLIKDPAKRMGSVMGATSIKNHPFFHGVNWALLRHTTPPFVPTKTTKDRSLADHSSEGHLEHF